MINDNTDTSSSTEIFDKDVIEKICKCPNIERQLPTSEENDEYREDWEFVSNYFGGAYNIKFNSNKGLGY